MRVLIVLLYLLTNARSETRTVQYMHVAKKTGHSQPIRSGYVYSQRNNEPAEVITINNQAQKNIEVIDMPYKETYKKCNFETELINKMCELNKQTAKRDQAPVSKLKLNETNGKQVQEASEIKNIYDSNTEFEVDKEDVRTDNRNLYDDWPHIYHSSYDNDPTIFGNDYQKASEKHFMLGADEKIIPVYENVEDDPQIHNHPTATMFSMQRSTNNPISADKPFISFVLNDYFDRANDEDYLTFKGLSFDKEYDHMKMLQNDKEDYGKRIRRLHDHNDYGDTHLYTQGNGASSYQTESSNIGSKEYNDNHAFGNNLKGGELNQNESAKSKYNAEKYNGFRDLVDSFANKFGSEDHNKNSKYKLKLNSDKGEKKKGFRRVYHKDEYQEDNEFYDNSNNNTASEQNGASKAHVGGSEAFLRSQATSALGNEYGLLNENKDYNTNNFGRNNESSNYNKGYSKGLDNYKNMAKHAALLNNVDYIDRYVK